MTWKNRLLHGLPIALFALAMWIIWHELQHIQFKDVRHAMNGLPKWRLGVALGLTLLNYIVLIGYDWTAVRAIGVRLPLRQVAMASFAGFAISYNVSALFGGTAVRYRYYSQWGLSALDLFRLILMIGITFWMGVLSLAGVMLVASPIELPARFGVSPEMLGILGYGLLALTAAYVGVVAWRRAPVRLRGVELQLPGLPVTLLQLLIAALDLSIASSVLYVLLGAELHVSFPHFLAVYLLAMVIVMFSHVPGGVGVFELVVVAGLGAEATPGVVAALLIFRIIYYLAPLAISMCWMAAYELTRNRLDVVGRVGKHGTQAWDQVKQWWPSLAPSLIAIGVFMAGALLLISGATPAESHRLSWLTRWVPLSLMEISHFLGSLVGVVLLLLAHGLQRRLDTAFWTTMVFLAAGICFSLLKGWDYEEAIFLSVVLLALAPCQQAFYRKGRWLTAGLSYAWFGPVVLVVMCSIWIGLFVNKHVEYRDDLWWQFALSSDAPRFLRATIGVVSGLLVFGVMRLLAPHAPPDHKPTPEDCQRAEELADSARRAAAQLARLGDKQFHFSQVRDAMIMYARQGRSWIAMGDPIGPVSQWSELIWSYRELVDRHAGWPVFYQVSTEGLSVYLDQGLTLLKIGEEARIDLKDFSLEGPTRRGLRQTVNRLQREDVTFEVVPAADYPAHAERLREISQGWLAEKNGHEKGFSLGFFDDDYLAHYRMALVRQHGEIVAFANLWSSGEQHELSPDLMRYVSSAPSSVMEYLFTQLMLWGKEQGYQWFSLGMAPLSGIEAHKLAPVWNRMTHLVYRHGEHFYSFEGLRRYKDKFNPTWSPKYLAIPGGAALPLILTDVTRLISRHR